jgi:hypothetical protein
MWAELPPPQDDAVVIATRAVIAAIGNIPLVGNSLESVAADLYQRRLSRMEKSRIERVMELVKVRIDDKIRLGHTARGDDFIIGTPGKRSFSEEAAEGVFRTAQEENEEAKLPFFAELLANFVFVEQIDRTSAVNFVTLAGALTFRQYCLLALIQRQQGRSTIENDVRFHFMDGDNECPIWQATLAQEIFDLDSRRLVTIQEASIRKLGQMPIATLTRLGEEVVAALGLRGIEEHTLDDIHQRAAPSSH